MGDLTSQCSAEFSHITFNRMTENDIAAVLEIENRSHVHPWTAGIFRDCLRVGYGCWTIKTPAEQIIGFGILSYAVGEAHVLNVCVDKPHHRRGIGKQIMLYLLESAAKLGADTVLLEVRPSNIGAIKLYENLGFNEVGVRRNYYISKDGKEDAIIMAYTCPQNIESESLSST